MISRNSAWSIQFPRARSSLKCLERHVTLTSLIIPTLKYSSRFPFLSTFRITELSSYLGLRDIHSSHLLQPLDVGCFSALKRFYGQKVEQLMGIGISHIDKQEFLQLYQQVRPKALHSANIQSSFAATGLVPYNPSRVLALFNAQLRTPSPCCPFTASRATHCAAHGAASLLPLCSLPHCCLCVHSSLPLRTLPRRCLSHSSPSSFYHRFS